MPVFQCSTMSITLLMCLMKMVLATGGLASLQHNEKDLDTLFYIGDEVLRNPSDKDLDSTMVAWQRNEPDSISTFQVTKDSTYTFPITNYQSSLLETRIAGDRGQVSEVIRQSDMKFLYKLRVDSITLRKRNVNARPTEYMKKLLSERRAEEGKVNADNQADTSKLTDQPVFQSEFENETRKDSGGAEAPVVEVREPTILEKSKLFNYRLKFSNDYIVSGVSNNILINRYQPYGGGSGPIQLGNGSNLNFTFRASVSDLLEDIKFVGGFRMGTNLSDNEYLFSFQNYRKRFDWGATYYRTAGGVGIGIEPNSPVFYTGKLITNIYQINGAYPLNEVKSLRATFAYRNDRVIVKPPKNSPETPPIPTPEGLAVPDGVSKYALGRLEYVHDNTINPGQNIWHGLRYKAYFDVNMPVDVKTGNPGTTFNLGFDARHYLPIYRNFIWAVRTSADFSWGTQEVDLLFRWR